jgi:uncharacterized protein YdeI (YjbR/CyaY-like superfamily)
MRRAETDATKMPDRTDLLTFEDRAAWRRWLEQNHLEEAEAWLAIRKKGADAACLPLDHAVEEALCFGWIDGKLERLDDLRYALRFTQRRSGSVWSVRNIRRVERLMAEGRMSEFGLSKVAEGRASGQWEAAIRREDVDRIPEDLERALRRKKGALAAYRSLTSSRKKQLLHWIFTAKRRETRKRRVEAIVEQVVE